MNSTSAGGSTLIVVGVDGSKQSRQALVWACEEAELRGSGVLALSTWTPPTIALDPPFGSFPWGASADRTEETRAMLATVVDEVAAEHPGVQIRSHVVAGNAAQELITWSEQAELIVVGSRGHGGFAGMLLGSVSQHVLAHSACTVVVVR